jgi:ABC-type dipeptide/oligopeptide/nickel transport system permease component
MLIGMMVFLFLVLYLTPGDPAQVALGDSGTPESVAQLRNIWRLDDPLYEQVGRFILGVFQGDLGDSLLTNRPVISEIMRAYPATMQLVLGGILVAVGIGVPLGILAATRPGSLADNGIMITSIIGLSVPVFVTGLVAILVFSYHLGWFPVSGQGGLRHLVLPAVTLSLPTAAELARMTRSSMLDQMSQEYLRTARAKGLTNAAVVMRHAFKNALIPIVTLLGLRIGALLAGAVVTETIFSWPGLGRLLLDAILARDYPLIRGGVLVIAVAFLLVNLIVDLVYGLIDPRIRYR